MTEYIVEEIVGKKIKNGQEFYFVKWKGYPEEENTWEPRSHFNDISIINDFENKIKNLNIKKEKKVEKKNKNNNFIDSSNESENNFLNHKRKNKKNYNNDNNEEIKKNNKKEKKQEEGKLGINKIERIKHCYYNNENEKNPYFSVQFKSENNINFKDAIFEFEELVKKESELIARYLMERSTFTEKRKKKLNNEIEFV